MELSMKEQERAQVIKALKALSDARFEIEMVAAQFGEKNDFLCHQMAKDITSLMSALGESRL